MLRRMRRHLGARVVVGVHRVVDEAGVHLVVVQRALARASARRRPTGRARRSAAWACTSPPGGRWSPSVSVVARRSRSVTSSPGARRGLVAVHRRGVQRGPLDGRVRRLARVDDRELQVGREAVVGDGADLDLVDLADQQRVGAGARVPRLLAVRVGAVVVVVLEVDPVGPGVAGAGADLDGDAVARDHRAVRPGDADGAVAGDRLREAGDGASAGSAPALPRASVVPPSTASRRRGLGGRPGRSARTR